MIQCSLPALVFAPGKVKLDLKGGTDVSFSPPIQHTNTVLSHYLAKFGITKWELDITSCGFYPKAGGDVQLRVGPMNSLNPVTLTDRGELKSILVSSWVTASIPLEVSSSFQLIEMNKKISFRSLKECQIQH